MGSKRTFPTAETSTESRCFNALDVYLPQPCQINSHPRKKEIVFFPISLDPTGSGKQNIKYVVSVGAINTELTVCRFAICLQSLQFANSESNVKQLSNLLLLFFFCSKICISNAFKREQNMSGSLVPE